MKACVAGATGAIGRLVVNGLAKDRRCAKVQVIVRVEKPAAFWFLSDAEFAKVEQVVAPDVAKLDASKITACDVGFCCIGLYAADGVKEPYFREIEVGCNTVAAEAMKAAGAKKLCYLSGAGVTGKGIMFSRVKGAAEVSLREVALRDGVASAATFACFRPPGIMDRPGRRVYGVMESCVNSSARWLLNTNMMVRAEDVAWAMMRFAFADPGTTKEIYEASDIKAEAQHFEVEQGLEKTTYKLGM